MLLTPIDTPSQLEALPENVQGEVDNTSGGVLNSATRSLRSSLLGSDANQAAAEAFKSAKKGDKRGLRESMQRAQQLAEEAQYFAPRVQSVGQIEGVGDLPDYLAGQLGAAPVGVAKPVVGGLAGGAAGMMLGGPAGAAVGGMAGGLGTMYPDMQNAALMEHLQALNGQEPTPEQAQEAQNQASWQAAAQTLPYALTPELGLAGRALAGKALLPVAGTVGKSLARGVATQAAMGAASSEIGHQFQDQYNPGRDKSHDAMSNIDAGVSNALIAAPFEAAGHAGEAFHGAVDQAGGIAAAGGKAALGAAGKLAGRAGEAAKEAWNNRPKDMTEAAVMAGEGAAGAVNKAEDAFTRFKQRGKDADIDTLLKPQSGMKAQDLQADDNLKHAAASNVLAKIQSDPEGFPDEVKQAAATYANSPRTMDDWRPLADSIYDWKRTKDVTGAISDFIQETTDKGAKAASDIVQAGQDAKTAYDANRRQNAQTPDDGFNTLLADSLKQHLGLRTPLLQERVSGVAAGALRDWIEGGFTDSSGAVNAPRSLLRMLQKDPVNAVKNAADLMHRQGLIDDATFAKRNDALKSLQENIQTNKKVAQLVDERLLPTVKADMAPVDRRDLIDHIASGKLTDAESRQFFGPRGDDVTTDLQNMGLLEKPKATRTEEQKVSTDELRSMTDEIDPNVVAERDQYHHYNESGKETIDPETGEIYPAAAEPYRVGGSAKNKDGSETLHDKHAEDRIQKLQDKNGSTVRKVGYFDYLREIHKDNPEQMVGAALDFMRRKEAEIRALPGKGSPDEKANANYYVLRETHAGDRGEATNIEPREFASLGKTSKWAEQYNQGDQGTAAAGRIWLERKNADGTTSEFATSTAKIIKNMADRRRGSGGVDESSGLGGQHTLLMQGLAGLASNEALTGRIGVKLKANGKIKWLSSHDKLPDDMPMYKKGSTLGEARRMSNEANLRQIDDSVTKHAAQEKAHEAAEAKPSTAKQRASQADSEKVAGEALALVRKSVTSVAAALHGLTKKDAAYARVVEGLRTLANTGHREQLWDRLVPTAGRAVDNAKRAEWIGSMQERARNALVRFDDATHVGKGAEKASPRAAEDLRRSKYKPAETPAGEIEVMARAKANDTAVADGGKEKPRTHDEHTGEAVGEGRKTESDPRKAAAENERAEKALAAKKAAAAAERTKTHEDALTKLSTDKKKAIGWSNAEDGSADWGQDRLVRVHYSDGSSGEKFIDANLSADYKPQRETRHNEQETKLDSHERSAKLITRLADARRDEFVHAPKEGVFKGAEGATSFGPAKDATVHYLSDENGAHAFVIPKEFEAALQKRLAKEPKSRAADVLSAFAIQHAFYDPEGGEFSSFGPRSKTPGFDYLVSKDALGDAGKVVFGGDTNLTRVEGVTARETTNFLAGALAYTKHAAGTDELPVHWTRVSGANKGKIGDGMFSAQDPDHGMFGADPKGPATNAERVKFFTDITRRLGPDMKAVLEENLWGKTRNGKDIPISGEWSEGLIKASVYARDLGQVGAHESFHEFFNRLKDQPQAAKVMDILTKAADSAYIQRQLERLLDGEMNALKQIKKGAPNYLEERMAYMFQFHQAGLLKIGPETETTFQKISRVFRKIAGLLNNDEKADAILRAFDKGEMKDADAAARVLANNIEAREKLYGSVNTALKPALDKLSRVVNTAETNLRRNGYDEVRRMFKRSVGESGQQGFLDAKDHQMKLWSNKVASVFEGLSPKDLELAAPYLHSGQRPTDPVVMRLVSLIKGGKVGGQQVEGLLPAMHKYLTDAGVKLWVPDPSGKGGSWEPMGHVKNYFPRVFDTAEIVKNPNEFAADLAKHNAAELNTMAAEYNAEAQKADPDNFVAKTAEDFAKAITNRMINSFGQASLGETSSAVGFSPFMQAVNRRSMDWIHPEMLKKYGEKDVAKILSSYVAQGVKRAEYVRRFGNGGEILKEKLTNLHNANLASALESKFGVKGLLAKANAVPDKVAADMHDKLWTALHSEMPKADRKDFDKLTNAALKAAKGAATDVMAMEGTLGYNINPKMRRFQNSALVYENMRTLSTSLFSQFIDPLGLVVRGGTMGDAWNSYKRGMREVVASIKGEHIKDLDSMIADQVGTTDAGGMLAAYGQLYSSQYMGAGFRKANDMLFKYNGMEGFNRGMQVSATRAAINFIKRHADQKTANERSTEYLKELNLKASDVKVDKNGELDYTNPKIQNAIHQWVNGSIMRPNAAQRPAWGSDPHYMMFWHMKQFAYTFHDVIMKRAQYEAKKFGDLGPAGVLAAAYTPMMIAADAMKSILLTGSEPGWMKAGLASELEHGAMRAGLMGKFQPLADVALTPGRSMLGLGGPLVEQIAQLADQTPSEAATNAMPGANLLNMWSGHHAVEVQGED